MKTIESYTISYVVPESETEKAEIEALVKTVSQEKLGIDFHEEDLVRVRPQGLPKGGYWIEGKK